MMLSINWVLDALRRTPHPTHAHLAQSLEWIARAAPQSAVITNMHIDLDYDAVARETPDHDYDAVARETPDHVRPAHDGMVLELEL